MPSKSFASRRLRLHPGEEPLHHPTARQYLEADLVGQLADNLYGNFRGIRPPPSRRQAVDFLACFGGLDALGIDDSAAGGLALFPVSFHQLVVQVTGVEFRRRDGREFLQGDLKLPAGDEPLEDIDGSGVDIGAEEGMGMALAEWIADLQALQAGFVQKLQVGCRKLQAGFVQKVS